MDRPSDERGFAQLRHREQLTKFGGVYHPVWVTTIDGPRTTGVGQMLGRLTALVIGVRRAGFCIFEILKHPQQPGQVHRCRVAAGFDCIAALVRR